MTREARKDLVQAFYMPIKLPKGFQRRKSSGSALEELPNPPEPSFRVFERPHGRKSFDGGNNYNNYKRISLARPLSAGPFGEDHLFVDGSTRCNPPNRYVAVVHYGICSMLKQGDRGSGGTHNSASSGGLNDNSSCEARFSSTSTLPSSADVPMDDRPSPNTKDPYNIPAPPVPESHPLSLKAAGRAFSFGRKRAESPSVAVPGPRPAIGPARSDGYQFSNRPRAMTESSYASESTATPPRLLGTELELEQDDLNDFGNMFESFGKNDIKLVKEPGVRAVGNVESPVCLEGLKDIDCYADDSVGEPVICRV